MRIYTPNQQAEIRDSYVMQTLTFARQQGATKQVLALMDVNRHNFFCDTIQLYRSPNQGLTEAR